MSFRPACLKALELCCSLGHKVAVQHDVQNDSKRKRRKHVSYQGPSDGRTARKLLESGRLTNSDIRKALSLWTGDEDAN